MSGAHFSKRRIDVLRPVLGRAGGPCPAAAPSTGEPDGTGRRRPDRRRWLFAGLAFGLLLVGLAIAVGSGQWQIRPILSGSMRPGFPLGGVAVTEREPLSALRVRDVVVTHPPGQPKVDLIHRVIEIKSVGPAGAVVQTMGDANAAPDPFTVDIKGPYIYTVRFAVPLVGYPAVALHSMNGRRILLGLAVVLVAVAALRAARDALRRRPPTRSAEVPESGPGGRSAIPAKAAKYESVW